MDRKSIIILVVSFIFLMAWYPLVVNKLYPPKPLPHGTNAVAAVANTDGTGTTNSTLASPPSLEATHGDSVPFVIPAGIQEQVLELTNSVAHYTFTSHGGGLKEVELLEYPESVSRAAKKEEPLAHRVATLNSFTPAPAMAILGTEAVQGDGVFQLTRTATGVRAEKTLTNGLPSSKISSSAPTICSSPTSGWRIGPTLRWPCRSRTGSWEPPPRWGGTIRRPPWV